MKNPCILGRNQPNGPWAWLTLTTKFPRRSGTIHVAISRQEVETMATRLTDDWEEICIPFGCSCVSPQEPVDNRKRRFGQTLARSREDTSTGFLTLTREDLGLTDIEDPSPQWLAQHIIDLLTGFYSPGPTTFFADLMLRYFVDIIRRAYASYAFGHPSGTPSAFELATRKPGESLWSWMARTSGIVAGLPHWLDTFVQRYTEEQEAKS